MAYNENSAQLVRDALGNRISFAEKKMFGGIAFMVDDKMCLGVIEDDLMVRLHPDEYENALEQIGCRQMQFTGKPMKGYVFVSEEGFERPQDLQKWIELALQFNPFAKKSVKKK